MNKLYNVGVIVGRFQINKLHQGHIGLIRAAGKACDRLIIFVGTSVVRDSDRNPLDYRTREQMLTSCVGEITDAEITILPLPDQRTDELWSAELDRRIREVDPIGTVRLFGSRDSFLPHYTGNFSTIQHAEDSYFSATSARKAIGVTPIDSEDFRSGMIYGKINQYPKVHATVDIIVTHNDSVLLARKHNETNWRLIGGFVDPTDNGFEAAAIREVFEEADIQVDKLEYICSTRIDDWRYAKEQNKIMTTFFKASLAGGTIKAKDDIEEVKWFRAGELPDLLANNTIANAHRYLIETFIGKYYGENN